MTGTWLVVWWHDDRFMTSAVLLWLDDRYIPRETRPERLYHSDVCPVQTTIVVERNAATGVLLGYKEVSRHFACGNSTAKVRVDWLCFPGIVCKPVREVSSNTTHWGTLVRSCLSSLSHCGLICGLGIEVSLHDLISTGEKKVSQAGNEFYMCQETRK